MANRLTSTLAILTVPQKAKCLKYHESKKINRVQGAQMPGFDPSLIFLHRKSLFQKVLRGEKNDQSRSHITGYKKQSDEGAAIFAVRLHVTASFLIVSFVKLSLIQKLF